MSNGVEEYDSDQEASTQPENKKQKVTYTTRPRSMIDRDEHIRRLKELDYKNENEFERQLRLEREEAERKKQEQTQLKQTRIDADGTEYEYDPIVKGWFPKIPDDKFLQYQSTNYQAKQQQQQLQMKKDTFYLYNGKFFTWDVENNKWLDANTPYIYSYIDYATGIGYAWDQSSNQWKPTTTPLPQTPVALEQPQEVQKQLQQQANDKKEPGWFEVNQNRNTNVYVSGLPLDLTEEEFTQLMSKYGIIAKEVDTGKLKCKLYKDENGELKGDGRCCYLMVIIFKSFNFFLLFRVLF